MNPEIEAKRKELYEQYRTYRGLSEAVRAIYKNKLAQEASDRSENEREAFKKAILANVSDVQAKIDDIQAKRKANVKN
jgi:hypothetical protein